jgi:hypothetical protein
VVDVLNCDGSPQLAALEGEHYDHKGMGYGLTERAKDKMTGAGVIRMSGRLRSDEVRPLARVRWGGLNYCGKLKLGSLPLGGFFVWAGNGDGGAQLRGPGRGRGTTWRG